MSIVIPYRSYAGAQAIFGLLLAAGGAVYWREAVGIVTVVLGGMFLLIALLLWIIAGNRRRLVGRLAANNFVRWQYNEAEWAAHVERQRTGLRGLAWKGHLFFLGVSVAIAVSMHGAVDNMVALWAFVIGLGQVYMVYTVRNVARSHDRLGETGECIIGEGGLYVTGQCHAWGGGWINATLSDDARRLTFEFSTSPEGHAKVEIPVPEGQESKARHVAKRWARD